jgi:hypothetical protein
MKFKTAIYFLIAGFLLSTCKHQHGMVLAQTVSLDGKYQFDEVPVANKKRDWSWKYWELTIKGNKGTLEFDEVDRGIQSFSLSVNIQAQDDKVMLYLDSVIWLGYVVNLPSLKHGDLVMSFLQKDGCLYSNLDNSVFSNLDFLERRQAKFELIQ